MNPISKVSVALVVATLSVSPVLAAQNTAATKPPAAPTTTEQSTVMMPVASLIKDLGISTPDLLSALGSAKTVRVLHAKAEYSTADQKTLNSALTAKKADLEKFHTALKGDAKLKDVFAKNKVDPNNVIAIIPATGAAGTVDLVVM